MYIYSFILEFMFWNLFLCYLFTYS